MPEIAEPVYRPVRTAEEMATPRTRAATTVSSRKRWSCSRRRVMTRRPFGRSARRRSHQAHPLPLLRQQGGRLPRDRRRSPRGASATTWSRPGRRGALRERLARMARAYVEARRASPTSRASSSAHPQPALLGPGHRLRPVLRRHGGPRGPRRGRGSLTRRADPGPHGRAAADPDGRPRRGLYGYLLVGWPALTSELADSLVESMLRGWQNP